MHVNKIVIDELCRIIEDSRILTKSDRDWPEASKVGKQELELLVGGKHKLFETSKIGSYSEISNCKDEEGLSNFWYLI